MSTLNTSNDRDIAIASALASGADGAAVNPVGTKGVATSNGNNPFVVYCWGTFGGNTVKLQVSPDNGTTWVDYPSASFTVAGMFAPVYIGAQQKVRASNGAGGGAINMSLSPIA